MDELRERERECIGEKGARIEGDKKGRKAGWERKKKKDSEDVERDEKGALKVMGGRGGMLSSEVSSHWYQIAIPSTIPSTTAVISHLVPTETSRLRLLSVFLILCLKLSSIQTSLRPDSGLFRDRPRTEPLSENARLRNGYYGLHKYSSSFNVSTFCRVGVKPLHLWCSHSALLLEIS